LIFAVTDESHDTAQHYPFPELFPQGHISVLGHASSSSSGKPTFWFRGSKQKAIGVTLYDRIVRDAFRLNDKQRTLVVVSFSMGVWVVGTYTLMAFEKIAEYNPSISLMSPGIEINDICSILSEVAPHFENVVLVGYPGFLDLLFDQIESRRIRIPPKLFLFTSGDKSTEEWRDRIVAQLRLSGPDSVINIYGSSDGGILGFESPLTIAIRRQSRDDTALRQALFPASQAAMPGLFQFDPAFIEFERVNGELIFSADLDLPLIRYNIHDIGHLFTLKEMRMLIKDIEPKLFERWPFPFVTVAGRTDVAVVFFGLNIYPENIMVGINDSVVRPFLSGSFLAVTDDTADDGKERLKLSLELAPGQELPPDDQQSLICERIQWHLISSNIEYRKLCSTFDKRLTTPSIHFLKNGDIAALSSEIRTCTQNNYFDQCVVYRGSTAITLPLLSTARLTFLPSGVETIARLLSRQLIRSQSIDLERF
jgi:phenylacetate-CoA ligase